VFPEDALLKAVIAEPEDDAPRLIYADWLEENGQEARAEFIRVQIELARVTEQRWNYHELRDRNVVLLQRHELGWAGPFREVSRTWSFHRGFIRDTMSDLQTFVKHAGVLFAHSPLQWIIFRNARGCLGQLSSVPQLIRVNRLDMNFERLNDDDAHALARCSYLKCLNHLLLSDNQIGDSGARALASSPYLDSLDSLDLKGNLGMTATGQAALRRRFGERVRF
jgi:uncharacterized protein (TIGR02996 family)